MAPNRVGMVSIPTTSLTKKHFERRVSKIGDDSADIIYASVGRALSSWEHAEDSFAALYSVAIAPPFGSHAATRSYGKLTAATNRKSLIEGAAEVFFRAMPAKDVEASLKFLLGLYIEAGGRRNDIAHGMVLGDRELKKIVQFLQPNLWSSGRRDLRLKPAYKFSSEDIRTYSEHFLQLGRQAWTLREAIGEIFIGAPLATKNHWYRSYIAVN